MNLLSALIGFFIGGKKWHRKNEIEKAVQAAHEDPQLIEMGKTYKYWENIEGENDDFVHITMFEEHVKYYVILASTTNMGAYTEKLFWRKDGKWFYDEFYTHEIDLNGYQVMILQEHNL